MGYAPGESAHRLHLLRVVELGLQTARLGHVLDDTFPEYRLALGIVPGGQVKVGEEILAILAPPAMEEGNFALGGRIVQLGQLG